MRLLRAMKVKGGFGVLDDPDNPKNKGFLPRSLLWRRGKNTPTLPNIDFRKSCKPVPSWSWMAVSGGIDYFQLKFNGFDWQKIESPWSSPMQAGKDINLQAQARSFTPPVGISEPNFVFDDPNRTKQDRAMVIVLGIEKILEVMEAKHYVLVVVMMTEFTSDGSGHRYCKRLGAGHLQGKWLVGEPVPCALI
jgi:hypothetical protein